MLLEINDKKVSIPDKELETNMNLLDISKKEAINMWLFDHGYTENETVEKLTAKAGKIQHGAKSSKERKPVNREKKADPDKEFLIKIIAKALEENGIQANIVNETKLIEFCFNNSQFKIDLIKRRNTTK